MTDTPPLSDPLDFLGERDDQTGSYRRADPTAALIERANRYGWRVMLPGGDVHTVALARERGAFVGWCNCDGYRYHDGPCAHLITVRMAHEVGDPDAHGDPVRVPSVDHDDAEPQPATTTATPDRAVTDGGTVVEHAAGEDGRTFGRPEGML